MEAPTDGTDRDGCPVLRAWAGTPCIMQRLLKSRILAVNHATLGRAALSDNVEVLAPLINHLGTLDGSIYAWQFDQIHTL